MEAQIQRAPNEKHGYFCWPALVLAGECIYSIAAAAILHWHHDSVSLVFQCGLKTSVLQVSRIMDWTVTLTSPIYRQPTSCKTIYQIPLGIYINYVSSVPLGKQDEYMSDCIKFTKNHRNWTKGRAGILTKICTVHYSTESQLCFLWLTVSLGI